MEKKYWIGRKRSALAMARKAATSEARLVHYELAGRYSIKAAQCSAEMLPISRAASGAEESVLRLRNPASFEQAEAARPHLEPHARRDPHQNKDEGR